MPEPIMFPTMRHTPWRREISCFSRTLLPWDAVSTSATILSNLQPQLREGNSRETGREKDERLVPVSSRNRERTEQNEKRGVDQVEKKGRWECHWMSKTVSVSHSHCLLQLVALHWVNLKEKQGDTLSQKCFIHLSGLSRRQENDPDSVSHWYLQKRY